MLTAAVAGSGAAVAASDPYASQVSITAQAPVKQASGSAFQYVVQYTCSSLDGGLEGCADYSISIDLADVLAAYPTATPTELAAMFSLPGATGMTYAVVGGKLVITFDETVGLGNDNFVLQFTPPNYDTANNTSWDFLPEASSSNAGTSTVGGPAKGTATATVNHTITKDVVGTSFRDQGEVFDYKIRIDCQQPGKGALLAGQIVVTDKLPAALEFVSAAPSTTSVGGDGTLTWNYNKNTAGAPASCFAQGATGTAEITVKVRVKSAPDANAPTYGDAVENVAVINTTDVFGGVVPPKDDDASITVLDEGDPVAPGVVSFGKNSFGQLRDACDPAVDCVPGANREDESHTTFAGNWLGVLASQPVDVMSGGTPRPNEKTGMKQSGYKMTFASGKAGGVGYRPQLRDPVPCMTNKVGQVYKSIPLPGGNIDTPTASTNLCADPAFHVRTVSVWTDPAGDPLPIGAGYVAKVVYSDGTTADMIATSTAAHSKSFKIPVTPSGLAISEVRFPEEAGIAGATTSWGVFGYVDGRVGAGEIVSNQGYYKAFYKTNTVPFTGSDTADLLVVSNPQIGIEKSFSNNNAAAATARINLTGRLLTTSVTQDFTVTDLLPVDMTVQAPPATVSSTVSYAGSGGTIATTTVNGTVQVIDNFRGLGRQLIRITFAKADLDQIGPIQLVTTPQFTVKYVDTPTTYNNTAHALYPDPQLFSVCQQVPSNTQEPADPMDLNDNGNKTENYCYANASLTIPPKTTIPKYDVYKSVKGDLDAGFKPFPAVGIVSEASGSAQFAMGFRNTGGKDLKDVVVYDIFPYVGDTGVGSDFANRPRKSEFTPVFNGLVGTVDPNVVVAYTKSTNPCRDEVNPGDATCDEDWTTTAPDPADYADITGLRLTSKPGASFAPGKGFEVIAAMKVPDMTANPDAIAWNSVAGRSSDSTGPLLAISPPKVGITASSDPVPLQVEKTLDPSIDPATVAVGDTLTYILSVSNPWTSAQTFKGTDKMPVGLKLVNGIADVTGPQVGSAVTYDSVNNAVDFNISIPTGQKYQWKVKALVEPTTSTQLKNSFAPTGENPCTTPGDDGECVTVQVAPVELTITKAITDTGTFAPSEFTFNLSCTVGGAAYSVTPLEITGAGSKSVTLPQGALCSLVEADSGATSVVFTIDGDPYTAGSPFTVGKNDIAVNVNNTYEVGGLTVKKLLDGVGAALPTKPFDFSVVCTFNGSAVDNFTAAQPYTFRLTPSSLTHTVTEELPVGAHCTVTETNRGEADATPVPIEVAITAKLPATAQVTFTNKFSAGPIEVRKVLDGDWAATGEVDDFEFAINVTCTYSGSTLFTRSVVLKGGQRVVLDSAGNPVKLPLGAECTATEPDTHGASAAPVISGPVKVTAGDPTKLQDLELTVTNRFDKGALVIKKELTGVGATLASGPITFDVACTFEGSPVKGFPKAVSLTVPSGALAQTSDKIGPLPVGATCLTTETATGGADQTPAPVSTVITGNGTENVATASFTNAYSAGTLQVTKVLNGKYSDHDEVAKRKFTIAVTCEGVVDGARKTLVDRSFSLRGGETKKVVDSRGKDLLLPVGTQCWGEETDEGRADKSRVNHDAEHPVVVRAGAPGKLQAFTVTATNTFQTPGSVSDDEVSLDDDDANGVLPDAGGASFWLLVAGMGLLFGGVVLVRRRRADGSHSA